MRKPGRVFVGEEVRGVSTGGVGAVKGRSLSAIAEGGGDGIDDAGTAATGEAIAAIDFQPCLTKIRFMSTKLVNSSTTVD